METKTAVVVGGGIGGMLAARLLKKTFRKVYLVEKSDRCGGLLKSLKNESGIYFDYGTHFISDTGLIDNSRDSNTGLKDLDEILFEKTITKKGFHVLNLLKVGNYFRGTLNTQSQFANTSLLPQKIYTKGIVDLLNASGNTSEASNSQEYVDQLFGKTFRSHIFEPLAKKFFGCSLSELAPDTNKLLGLARLIALTPDTTRDLKKLPIFDKKLAFHSYTEGLSGVKKYYPKKGGIGKWADLWQKEISKMGVQIRTNEYVWKINHKNRRVNKVILGNGEEINCQALVWTIPAHICAAASGLKLPSKMRFTPKMRTTTLYHFVFDRPFKTDLHYVYCHDESFSSFRITLYPNIGATSIKNRPPYNCTVEVLSDYVQNQDKISKKVLAELVRMGITSESTKVLYKKSEVMDDGFPVVSSKFVEQAQRQLEFLKKSLKNVVFLGRASGSGFFIRDVLVDAYNQIAKISNRY